MSNSHNIANAAIFHEHFNNTPACQEPGCSRPGLQCEIPGGTDPETGQSYAETYQYFCPYHAAENGFCAICGTFIAGWIENDSYCENCRTEIRRDEEHQEDDDDQYEDRNF